MLLELLTTSISCKNLHYKLDKALNSVKMPLKIWTFVQIKYVPPVLRKWSFGGDHLAMGLEIVLMKDFEVSSLVMLCYYICYVCPGIKSVIIMKQV